MDRDNHAAPAALSANAAPLLRPLDARDPEAELQRRAEHEALRDLVVSVLWRATAFANLTLEDMVRKTAENGAGFEIAKELDITSRFEREWRAKAAA
jgi:hypothetical protein